MKLRSKYCLVLLVLVFFGLNGVLMASTTEKAKTELGKALLGKDVKALLEGWARSLRQSQNRQAP
jgi:hypothetical protein